jgi:hypothetical protein
MQLRLANLGFQSATVATNPGISTDGRSADVIFTVREGQRISVDHVLIAGNQRTRTATIERELQFKAGEPLGLEQVNESQRRLAALGLFRRVRITELVHGDETKRDVLVSVEEAPATTVGFGGGVEAGELLLTDEQTKTASQHVEVAPRAFFEVGRRNLFGKNRSVNLFTRVSLGNLQNQTTSKGFGEYRVIGTYREPRALGTAADAFLTGTLEQQIRSSFNFARRAVSAYVAPPTDALCQRQRQLPDTTDGALRRTHRSGIPDSNRSVVSTDSPVVVLEFRRPRHAGRLTDPPAGTF